MTFAGTCKCYWNIRAIYKRMACKPGCQVDILIYDPSTNRYALPIEHAQALINETSPAYCAGGFQILMALL